MISADDSAGHAAVAKACFAQRDSPPRCQQRGHEFHLGIFIANHKTVACFIESCADARCQVMSDGSIGVTEHIGDPAGSRRDAGRGNAPAVGPATDRPCQRNSLRHIVTPSVQAVSHCPGLLVKFECRDQRTQFDVLAKW